MESATKVDAAIEKIAINNRNTRYQPPSLMKRFTTDLLIGINLFNSLVSIINILLRTFMGERRLASTIWRNRHAGSKKIQGTSRRGIY